jgi:inorganic triphosphatase YgiF
MSAVHTTPAAAIAAGRTPLLRWIAGGALAAAIVCVVAIAAWPASEADKARDDGEQVGAAVSELYDAQSSAEVDAALAKLDLAVTETRAHAGDAVADQQDALARAADGFVGSRTTDDAFEADLYQAELDVALDDLAGQASDFRAQGPEVHQAFWEGVDDGLAAA